MKITDAFCVRFLQTYKIYKNARIFNTIFPPVQTNGGGHGGICAVKC